MADIPRCEIERGGTYANHGNDAVTCNNWQGVRFCRRCRQHICVECDGVYWCMGDDLKSVPNHDYSVDTEQSSTLT